MGHDEDGSERIDRDAACPALPDRVRGSSGRPTKEEAIRREARLLDVATEIFMARGYEATTIDSVAEAAGIGKRMLYARFPDKGALFSAVIRRQIAHWLAPIANLEASSDLPIETALVRYGTALLELALTPRAIELFRINVGESRRFPEFARLAHEEGWTPSIRAIAALLARHAAAGTINLPDPELGADLLLNMMVGGPLRRAALGFRLDDGAIAPRVRAAVRIFLAGVVPRCGESAAPAGSTLDRQPKIP